MTKYLRLSWLLLICLFPVAVKAQACNSMLFGTLRDNRNNSILPGATIKIKELSQIMVTDGDGHYHFNNICKGNYTLEVTYVGYQPRVVKVNVSAQKELDIALISTSTQLSGVQVAGVKAERKPLQVTGRLEGRALEMTRGQSLGEALKVIPGVNAIQTGPSISKPVIQGMSGNRVLISNAGVRQEGQQWGSEHAPEVDPFIASEVTVVKGASSVMYGADAIGGVVLLEPAPLKYQSGLGGQVNLVGMSNSGLGAFSGLIEDSPDKNNHFSWRLQGTTRIAGNAKTPNYYLKNTGLREYNGALMLGYRNQGWNAELYASSFNTKLGIFSGSNVGSTEDRNNAITRPEPLEIYQSDLNYKIDRPYQIVNHHLGKLKLSKLFDKAGTLNLQYSYQQDYREEYDVVRGSSQNRYQYQFDLTTQVGDIYFEHHPIAGISGRVGVNGIYQRNYYEGAYLIPFFKSYNGAGYIIERWKKNKLELEGGIRYDQKWMQATKRIVPRDNNSPLERPEFNFSQVTGTFGMSYHLPSGYRLTGTAAKGWRPPSINELFIEGVHQGNAAFERGDRNLKDESSLNLSAGISRSTGKLTGDISVYHNHIDNFIYLQPQLDAQGKPIFEITQRGGFLSYQYVQVNARFTGADALVAYQLTPHFKLTGKYATVRAYNTDTDEHLIYIPADRYTGMLTYGLPDSKTFKSTLIDFSMTHVARQSRVRDDQDFAPAPAGYTLVNAAISTTLPVHGYAWNLSLSVDNLLNKEYRDYLNRFRYYSADLGRNISLRLQIPFGKNNKS
ncbi:TonB-dependent receptor [Mucilaginibacter lacusdianchii]|uniref:TonB-dependent receptor n=1 Tax=Mucilaginibacter lacusdianchii TaxID=2684211 RepID=UPI00131EA7AC|nr:TonB-dependent receptor [Mucilaginibacter sp. JXJ CY 39]